jgi:hypothetical protein
MNKHDVYFPLVSIVLIALLFVIIMIAGPYVSSMKMVPIHVSDKEILVKVLNNMRNAILLSIVCTTGCCLCLFYMVKTYKKIKRW